MTEPAVDGFGRRLLLCADPVLGVISAQAQAPSGNTRTLQATAKAPLAHHVGVQSMGQRHR